MSARRTSLVFSYQHAGKYAFNVLAGAVEGDLLYDEVRMVFPRNGELLRAAVDEASARGDRIVVAWSFYSPSFPAAAQELAWLREQLPHARFVSIAGGVHATAETAQTLRAGFDLVAVGEGERTLPELLRRVVREEDKVEAP